MKIFPLGPGEVEAIKKVYVRVLEAYACLGVLKFHVGES